MCCLFTTLAFLGPRVALIIWWLVDMDFFARVFDTVFWPVVGIIFAPWTTLFYVIGWVGSPGIESWDYVWIAIGILLDITSYTGGAWKNRGRVPGHTT
jgi:hypothetical protein